MQFASLVVAAGIGLGWCGIAGAIGPHDDPHWIEAESLRELPAGIQVLLGVGLPSRDGGIADRGDRFNVSDVLADGLPMRRFALGIVNGDTVLVAVEHGGRGYSVQTLEFRQVGAVWAAVRCAVTGKVPRAGTELLETLATHPRPDLLACRLPGVMTSAAQPTASR